MDQATRKTLIERRKTEYKEKHPGAPDFSFDSGYCCHCRADLVEQHGENYPTAFVTGCRKCHRSYCD
jgi:hypothetical protein